MNRHEDVAASNDNEGRGHALHMQDDGAARVLPVQLRQEEVKSASRSSEEVAAEVQGQIGDYEQGYLDALLQYAHWKDGELLVGTTGQTYKRAALRFLSGRGIDTEGWNVNVRPA